MLSEINSPKDLTKLTFEQLDSLSAEIRAYLIEQVSKTGGHLGPNLGVVELTIAVHRIFESPKDVIVFDTGHQSYVHKLLTGRKSGFNKLRQRGGVAGYPNRGESDHDVVENSHASTALSWSDGIAKGFSLTNQKDRTVVCVVGDGALTGGMSWEALNNIAASKNQRLVIIVNDNERSYSPTIGGVATYLSTLRTTSGYERFLDWGKGVLEKTPVVGHPIYETLHGVKKGIKDIVAPQGMFEDLGLKYFGPVDGHNIEAIEKALKITDAVFDKTGTITSGQMVLLEMSLINNPLPNNSNTAISTSDLLMFASSVESLDSHPIADAIKFALEKQGVAKVQVSDFEHTAGVGVAARVNLPSSNASKAVLIGSPLSIARATTQFSPEIVLAIESANQRANSVAVLAVDGLAYGVFEVGDQIKPESKDAIQKLHKAGINTWLVTGDSETSAISIGSEVGIPIDHIFATATPEDKLVFVENLQKNGKVLMIGDGINDAAAIAKSDLSIAMGSGTDTAMAAADITLIRPSLLAVVDALDISKKSVRIIKSNLGWAFFYNIAFIPIAASGNLSPMYAAGAMSLSSLFVVLNSLRIK